MSFRLKLSTAKYLLSDDGEIIPEEKSTFVIGDDIEDDYSDNFIFGSTNNCIYDHFERFNWTEGSNQSLCYYLFDEPKSYNDAVEACSDYEDNALTKLNRKTHFRLAKGSLSYMNGISDLNASEVEIKNLYGNSGILENKSIWLPPAEEPEFLGSENLERVFQDCEVSTLLVRKSSQ